MSAETTSALPEEDADDGFALVAAEDEEGLPFRRAGPAERKLVSSLSSVLRVARLHTLDNVVAIDAQRELLGALVPYLAKFEQAAIILGDQRLGVNGAVVRLKRTGRTWLNDFLEFLERMGVHGIILRGTWSESSVKSLIEVFAKVEPKTPEERVRAIAAAAAAGVQEPARVEILDIEEAKAYVKESDEDTLSDAQRASFYYARLLAIAEASQVAVANGRSPDFHVRELRHTFIKIIDFLRTGLFELRLLGLTVLPYTRQGVSAAQGALAGHSANVAVLALAMGRLLGLSRGAIADLGFAALYHDLGRAPEGWVFSDGIEDRPLRHGHVARAVNYSLRGRGYGDAGLLRIIVGTEHHRKMDRFPNVPALRASHLYSRIVATADAFDRLEKGDAGSYPVSPAKAMKRLVDDKTNFEPPLTALLRDVLGARPRGTLLRMKDRTTCVVVDGGARRGHQPVVRRLLGADGRPDERRTLHQVVDPATVAVELNPEQVSLDWRRAVVS